jgi:hypothetical protein
MPEAWLCWRPGSVEVSEEAAQSQALQVSAVSGMDGLACVDYAHGFAALPTDEIAVMGRIEPEGFSAALALKRWPAAVNDAADCVPFDGDGLLKPCPVSYFSGEGRERQPRDW